MRFVVFGAGAIGSGLGGHLHRTGQDALLVGRAAHVERIRRDGLRLITADETHTVQVPAVSRAEDIGFTHDDVVLLCVKSQDTDRALVDIRAAGGDPRSLPILCCQNSITNEPAAARYFQRIYGVLIVVPGIFLEPGVVHNNSLNNAGFIEIGQFPVGVDALCHEVARAFSAASYAAYANPKVMATKAGKMFSNLGNAMGAITDGQGDSTRFMFQVRAETERCFQAAGVEYEPPDTFDQRSREQHRQSPLPAGVRNLGSSWQSLQRGLGSIEADFLNGEIVRLGRLHGIPTPYNEVLQEVANAMAAGRDKPGKFSPDDLERLATSRQSSGPATSPRRSPPPCR
ncbi:MAG TPA: 2-dehydropantoate 2-reductase N-terminal domain-containing protein [Chloroflexota bacterium]|nr:2-dehydropantoate 2-reductase N-terminal domain-containing protein [Chloroflexota bacterium]